MWSESESKLKVLLCGSTSVPTNVARFMDEGLASFDTADVVQEVSCRVEKSCESHSRV
jgi:hypothetical protein